jgi:NADPH-dependent curcumin reductase CurA
LTGREVRLISRPRGWPTAANFELATVPVPAPAAGQILVRNLFISVDPYMRGRMNDVKSYSPPYELGRVMSGAAIGEVLESRTESIKTGDLVLSARGWRDLHVADAREVRVVDRRVQPLSAYLGVLGTTGMTAWVGLGLAKLAPGDRVFVSAAAGAVGSVAGQIARHRGCFVVGSAGSAEKVRMLVDEFGFNAAFNYRDGDLAGRLAKSAPDGIDVYFDNVGGDHLEAAIEAMRDFGRIVACGTISRYNDETPAPGPRNLHQIVTKRLTIRGFIVLDHGKEQRAFFDEIAPLVTSGNIRARETVVEGLDRAVDAFLAMLRGENVGKMIVEID